MSILLQSFEDNVREVRAYFRFLEIVLEPSARVLRPNFQTHKSCEVTDETLKMLKSSSLLVLYNMVEATVCSALDAIYEAIKSDGVPYKNLSVELRNIWIGSETKSLSNGSAGIDKIRMTMRDVANEVLNATGATIDPGYSPVSSNIDAKQIRKLARLFGFRETFRNEQRKTSSLWFIKTKRNHLAHGEISFGHCGRELTSSILAKHEKEVVSYLRSFLKNVQLFLDQKKFLAQSA